MEQVRVRVLGPVEVLAPGRAVAVPGGRPRVVLAVLALHAGQAVGADRLAAALWDDRLPTNVRASLQTCVARLRRALDSDDLIETVRSGYVLRLDPEDVDLHRFRRLAAEAELLGDPIGARRVLVEALALWRGEPLTGVDSEALRRGEARGLTEEYLAAVERRVDLDMAAGRLEDLVPELRSLVGRYRLRESLWSRLILTQYRLGRAAEAIETYHKLRTVWVESLGVEPSGPVRQLYQGMLTGEMAQTPRMLPKPPPAAALARPWQIPADVRHFAGRRAELAALDELVVRNDSHAMFAVLDGSAGVGKTALAVRWAHRVRDRFPDGQLYLNLRGYGPGEPVRPETALSGFLRALGARADQIPDGLNERSAKFRNRLAGRRMLVLLDNARDAAQVRPLLPGAGNALLVTSRNQLRGLTARNGASRVEVARLSPEDAADLLNEHIAGPRTAAESDTVAELVELCARLPLALRVTAERINRSLGLPLAALARELRDERGRLDVLRSDDDQDADLRALLSWSYLALDGASARAFRLLGIHPGNDIGSAAAAALFDISEGEAAQLLDSLVSVHLLEQRTGDRYGFHDLLRGYAAETAQREVSATDRDVATRRILDWYLHTSYEGHYQLQPTVTPEFKLTRSLVAPLRLHTDVAAPPDARPGRSRPAVGPCGH
jgi:DNA-binding SARP family transcriptional activator